MSEEQKAIDQLKHGDIQGLATLVELHQLTALRTAYAITKSREMAEDMVADAFLAVYDHIEQFKPDRFFKPWFYRIVVNGATKAVRSANRRGPAGGISQEILEQQPDIKPGPEESVLLTELFDTISSAIGTLPVKQRTILILRYYLEMGEPDIAQALGCPLGTVKWRLHSARRKLRQVLGNPSAPPQF